MRTFYENWKVAIWILALFFVILPLVGFVLQRLISPGAVTLLHS